MFAEFLKNKLKERKIDESIYHSYIISILEDNIDEDEKREMLTDIISSLIESDTESVVNDIFLKWNENNASSSVPHKTTTSKNQKIEETSAAVDLAKMLENSRIAHQSSSYHNRQLTDEEKRIKEQILANYSQCSDKEEDDEDENVVENDDHPDLEKNTNKLDVQKLAREKREVAKLESQQKKKQDKENKEKQKTIREEKKANRKAKAVKIERKR